jgi:hypothetical protein
MRLKENFEEISLVLQSSEKLWRLLYYKPIDSLDNPLDTTKPDVLAMPDFFDTILPQHLIYTPKSDDLTPDIATRICLFPGRRSTPSNNMGKADQEVIFDVFVHADLNDKDMRLTWILDTIHELMYENRITGIGKVIDRPGSNLPAPSGFIGYRLPFNIGSVN